MATSGANRLLIGSSALNGAMMTTWLVLWSDPPVFIWAIGLIGICASISGIVSEVRRAQRAATDPWSLKNKAGPPASPGRGWGVAPNPWE